MFWVQNRVFRAWFSTLPTTVVPGPGKVVKIRSKHFSIVLTENDMNCTTNYVGMFRVQNWVIWARFSTLAALVRLGHKNVVKTRPKQFSTLPAAVKPRPRKVVKIRPKFFSTVLSKKHMNCTTNYVGMFRVQTESSRPGFPLYLL